MSTSSAPEAQHQITWVYTEDLEGTTGFYERTLGLELAHDQGSCRIYRTAPAAFLGVCRARPGREVEPRGVVITLVTDDVDGWFARLSAANAPTDGAPRVIEPFNVYAFFATDPNGYRLEFQRFLGPAWSSDA